MRVLWLLIFLKVSALAQTGTGLTVTTRTEASINFNFGTAIPAGSPQISKP